jgi:hypothetical protein
LGQKAANVVPIFEGGGAGVPQFHLDQALNDVYSQEGGTPMHNYGSGEKNTTDDYKAEMKKGNSNILVAVRCRPLSIKEK